MEAIARQRRSTLQLVGALFILSFLALTAFTGQAQAATPLVVDVAPSGADFTSISQAVQGTPQISTGPVKIRVAAGNYRDVIMIEPGGETDQTTQIFEPGAFDLTIEGGWSSGFTNRDPSRATNIFGLPLVSVMSIDDSTVTIDGLTLTQGFDSNFISSGEGGGLWLCDSKVVLNNSKIIRTGGVYVGGVMSINSDLTVRNSEIAENEVGGLHGLNAVGPVSVEPANKASLGTIAGGIAVDRGKLTLVNSTVRNNTSWGVAGGLYLYDAKVVVDKSRILNNDARGWGFGPGLGGGAFVLFSDVSVTNSIVAGNFAGQDGGGIYVMRSGGILNSVGALPAIEVLDNRLLISNSTIANNTAAGSLAGRGQGGGVHVGDAGRVPAAGSAVEQGAETDATPVSTAVIVGIKNSVIWGNQAGDANNTILREGGVTRANGFAGMNFRDNDVFIGSNAIEEGALVTDPLAEIGISYSDIGVLEDTLPGPLGLAPGSAFPTYGLGNISADPKFVYSADTHFIDASTANYHLMKYSPAIDSGTPLGAPAMDLDSASRPAGLGFDMGAYEEQLNFDVIAPTPRVRSPRYSTQHTNDTKFRVIWSAVDPAPSSNGIEYEVWVRRGGTGKYKKWLGWTSLRHGIFNGDRGHTYYFRVRAKDAAGNISRLSRATMSMVPYDGLSAQLIRAKRGFSLFVGARHNTSYYMDTALTSRTRGDFIRYRLKGRRFSLISTRGPRMSRIKVYVDGVRVKTLDLRAPTNKYRKVVWNINFPTDGTHIIKFVNLATPGRPRMDIDGLARQLK